MNDNKLIIKIMFDDGNRRLPISKRRTKEDCVVLIKNIRDNTYLLSTLKKDKPRWYSSYKNANIALKNYCKYYNLSPNDFTFEEVEKRCLL